ncbi:hypothetical protein BIV24_24365 [Streptomyces colonosanans]|uniref:Uncharacterized protein n=2 Tax=Streptomyces colonosanans TaxID=1428652 RepID=A0A1S2P1L6_9ACTN|nr:hypothetical protein BIV24_24365 [Streptomyces colonosanans]
MTALLERTETVYRRYTAVMADTTVKVDPAVRDRLMVLARERGMTMRDLIAELAGATPTREELLKRYEETKAYCETHFGVTLTDEDHDRVERVWQDLEAGRPVDSL